MLPFDGRQSFLTTAEGSPDNALFFGIISYLVMFRFTKTDQRRIAAAKRDRNRIYIVSGATMIRAD